MTYDESRQITRSLEYSSRNGGYLLAHVRSLAVEYPSLTWEALRLKLATMAYYGGYPLSAIQRNFEIARAGAER